MIEVSNSKLELWDKCKYAYYLRYGEKLERATPPKPQFTGNWVHRILEEDAKGKDWRKVHRQYSRSFRNFLYADEYGKDPDLPIKVRAVIEEYFKYYRKSGHRTVAFPDGTKAEYPFRERIAPGIYLTGIIDRLVADANDRLWIMDHKTTGNIPSEGVHDFDLQSIIYTRILKVRGMIWDYIKFNPTMPTLTQAGELSEKKIDTLPYLYEYLTEKHGLDIPEKILERMIGIQAKFFVRHKLRTKSITSRTILNDVVTKAKDIRKNGCTVRTRTLGRHCSWCSYRKLCLVRLHGLDDSRLIGNEYVYSTSKERKRLRPSVSGNGAGSRRGRYRRKIPA